MIAGLISFCRLRPARCLGLLAFLSVTLTLDVSNECAWTGPGPGLTFDENLNTAGGVYVVESIVQSGLAVLDPRTLIEIFNSPNYFPDYPPLGRLPLGLSNAVLARVGGLGEHSFYQISYARVGSALAFGLLVGLIAGWTGRRAGTVAGVIAGLSLWWMPRVFGHAHLASVETMMNLTYAVCVLGSLECLSEKSTLRPRDGLLPGVLLGLALLTKIQGIFLPPILLVWLLWTRGKNGLLPLVVLALTSAFVFLAGWPWLWADPLGRSFAYFAQTTDRAVLYCFYFGERFTDRAVPWHYPFVTFLTTTPLTWLLLGSGGMALAGRSARARIQKKTLDQAAAPIWSHRQNLLLLGAFWLPLVVFAIPGVPVYDGERLFLVVWPIFSIWVGIGGQYLWHWLQSRVQFWLRWGICLACGLLPALHLLTMFPAELSFYGIQVGGLRGAAALGMEECYWGDAATPGFLQQACEQIPRGSTLGVAPVLHPLIPQFLKNDSWLIHRPDLNVIAYDDKLSRPPRYVLWIHRRADPWQSLQHPPAGTRRLARFVRQAVVLAEVLEFPPAGEAEPAGSGESQR